MELANLSRFFYAMKYNISINQFAAVKHGLNLDFLDLAIFDFIRSFINSGNCQTTQIGNESYYWISYKKIKEDLPLLPLNSGDAIYRRVKKLTEVGLLQLHPKSVQLGRSYFCKGLKFNLLEFSDPSDLKPGDPRINKRTPSDLKPEDNSIKDNGISDNKGDLVYPFDTKEFLEAWGLWKIYKKTEKGFKFKSLISEQAALKKLSQIADTDQDAINIINQSIENGWSGLFASKQKHNGQVSNYDLLTD